MLNCIVVRKEIIYCSKGFFFVFDYYEFSFLFDGLSNFNFVLKREIMNVNEAPNCRIIRELMNHSMNVMHCVSNIIVWPLWLLCGQRLVRCACDFVSVGNGHCRNAKHALWDEIVKRVSHLRDHAGNIRGKITFFSRVFTPSCVSRESVRKCT